MAQGYFWEIYYSKLSKRGYTQCTPHTPHKGYHQDNIRCSEKGLPYHWSHKQGLWGISEEIQSHSLIYNVQLTWNFCFLVGCNFFSNFFGKTVINRLRHASVVYRRHRKDFVELYTYSVYLAATS